LPQRLIDRRSVFLFAALAAGLSLGSATAAPPPEPRTFKGHTGWVGGVAFSPDGKRLATASADTTVKLWDVDAGKEIATLKGHTDAVTCVAFGPDPDSLVSGSFDQTVRGWIAKTGLVVRTSNRESAVLSVALRRDGKATAVGRLNGTVEVWDGRGETILTEHQSWVNGVTFSPDGRTLASASSDNTVILRDADTLRVRRVLRPKAAELRSVAFSPDGKLLAAGTRYGLVKVWDPTTGQELATIEGHAGDVWAVAFAPDSGTLASGDGDWNRPGDVRLWDTATWKERGKLTHSGEVLCLAFAPNKPLLAAGSWDKTVRLWDLTETLKADR
jgi:WD40 repeat protein